ncbi:hypothetical protein [Aequorivita lipolytica]|uniref:PorT family protein n=1 Tax=Aequorivita lipolytica TaxID=153267 RepID=A0A5C6YTW2_9FLAO|nr:hypothetical protein [Aequorivita lipolytica]TXD70866.1 hypothetical protein ESV24_01895 [Aequorivita lipolytica]SRX49919.1 hypothetical protein AEQU2_00384 [Aequorivita lipolytica]
MKLITFTIALSLWLSAMYAEAQEIDHDTQTAVEQLTELKEKIIQEEKDALLADVENINKRLETGSLNKAEAETLKQEAAENHALNIENRLAIIDNKVALLKRNGNIEDEEGGMIIRISSTGKNSENDNVLYIGPKNKKRKYDRRTSSDFVFAFGLNNVITEGESLQDSDFKVAGSRFAELGWTWKTRVFKNTNWLRVKYGVSFQFNGLKPTDNRFYVDTGEQTELQNYPLNLDKSKFRMDNLVVPIHFEFGPSKKIENDDYFRYSTENQVRVGLGGYAGINLGSRQKLKFEEDGEDQKLKLKANYNTNSFIYGLSGYIGWQGVALYAKYDLNTIFKSNPIDQRNVSLGLRFDVD